MTASRSEDKMKRLVAQLREQQAEAAKLDDAIAANLKGAWLWRSKWSQETTLGSKSH